MNKWSPVVLLNVPAFRASPDEQLRFKMRQTENVNLQTQFNLKSNALAPSRFDCGIIRSHRSIPLRQKIDCCLLIWRTIL